MQKKIVLIFIVFILFNYSVFSQDVNPNKKIGYYQFLNDLLGQEIIVTINYADITISGILLEIFEDGIIIESIILKQRVFIPKSSIALIKVNTEKKK